MIVLIGPPDASWQEPARFRARTRWPAEALRIVHPGSLAGPADLPVEAVVGVVLDGTRPDLSEFYASHGIPVEVEVEVPAESPVEGQVVAADPAGSSATAEELTTDRPGRGE